MLSCLISLLSFIQNAPARLFTSSKGRGHIIPILAHLHWQPERFRIYFRIFLITFNSLKGVAISIFFLISQNACRTLFFIVPQSISIVSNLSTPVCRWHCVVLIRCYFRDWVIVTVQILPVSPQREYQHVGGSIPGCILCCGFSGQHCCQPTGLHGSVGFFRCCSLLVWRDVGLSADQLLGDAQILMHQL